MRNISEIATEIGKNWTSVNYGAVPYLDAMHSLNTATDSYGQDSAKSIVLYFLANAQAYRGDIAKRTKAELKEIIGEKLTKEEKSLLQAYRSPALSITAC